MIRYFRIVLTLFAVAGIVYSWNTRPAFALPPFGGRIVGTFLCSVDGKPAIWISVGPPRPAVGFIFSPPVTQWHLYFNFTPSTMVIGNTLGPVPVIGTCNIPDPPFVIERPGLVITTIGTSVK